MHRARAPGRVRKDLAIALLALHFAACGDRPEGSPSEGTEVQESRLRSEQATSIVGERFLASEHFGLPTEIVFAADRLVVLDNQGDPWVHLIDADEARVVKSFGRRGEGPTEFRGVTSLLSSPADAGYVWVFDANGRKLVPFSLSGDHRAASSHQVIRLSSPQLVARLTWIAPDRMFGTGRFSDGTFVEIDRGGGVGPTFGPSPDGPKEVPLDKRHHASFGKIAANASLSLVARASHNSGRLDLFNFRGRRVGSADVPVSFTPEAAPPDREAGETEWGYPYEGSHVGYLDLATTDDLIFALFSGGLRTGSFLGDDEQRGHEVYVFTWSGELVRVFALEEPGPFALTVDPEARRMWTLVWHPEPAIRFYPVQGLLPAGLSASPDRD